MNNMRKFIVACLITIVGSIILTAQAGTSRSLGGHSMVNARNCTSSRNFGGHNLGGSGHSINVNAIKEKIQEKVQKIADHIYENGGTITVDKSLLNGTTVNVVTGKGFTATANSHITKSKYANQTSSGILVQQTGSASVNNPQGQQVYSRNSVKSIATGAQGTSYPGVNVQTQSNLINQYMGNSYSSQKTLLIGGGASSRSATKTIASKNKDKYISLQTGTDVSISSVSDASITHSTYVSAGKPASENGPSTVDFWAQGITTIQNTPEGPVAEHTQQHSSLDD